MPIVKIEDAVVRSPATRQTIVDCVFVALKDVFGVSDEELQARYIHFAREDFFPPGGDADYLHIEIVVFAGRKLETKKKLYARLSSDLSALLNIAPQSILILLREQHGDNWGMRGGQAASEIDFGYAITV
jgi:phenylpyruvate tautomerase PptA (4-oxalocrotonate tautomerase family)